MSTGQAPQVRPSASVEVCEPLEGKDVSDHLAAGHGIDELVPAQLPEESAGASAGASGSKSGGSTLAQVYAELILDQVELFHTPDDEAFALLAVNGHTETWAVNGIKFERLIRRLVYRRLNRSVTATTLAEVVGLLGAIATCDGPTRRVYQRVAEVDGVVYLDLANEEWEVVEIRPSGWRVLGEPPISFARPDGMAALPRPVAGGELAADLRPFLNVDDEGFILFCSWVLGALRPRGPYPVLDLIGEQGSAKSTAARIARALVDPNKAPLRSMPRDDRNLMISASNGWVHCFDNISWISDAMSDALCRLATGGGFATRQLYTDREETIIEAQRPIILTGIGEHANRGDLLDRMLTVQLAPISEEGRLTEDDLWTRFKVAHPRVLGAFLDAVAVALRDESKVELEKQSRMADFERWVIAAAPRLGWSPAEFQAAHGRSRGDAHVSAIEASPIGRWILEIDEFEGPSTELLELIDASAGEKRTKQKGWPGNASALSKQLDRLGPDLRASGIDYTRTMLYPAGVRLPKRPCGSCPRAGSNGRTRFRKPPAPRKADNSAPLPDRRPWGLSIP